MKIVRPAILLCLLINNCVLYAQFSIKRGKGYFNITNIAEPRYLQTVDSSSLQYAKAYIKGTYFGISTINGLFLNPSISVGIGIGLQWGHYRTYATSFTPKDASVFPMGYFDKIHKMVSLPIFGDFRFYPGNTVKKWALLLNVGYAPIVRIEHEMDKPGLNGGALLKLGAAYRLSMGGAVSFLPSVNFNAQRFGDNTTVGANVGLGFMF